MQEYLTSILLAFPVLAPALFILLRTLPVIIPPLPGILFDLVGVAMFGWQLGLILALISVHLGASVAFVIARYFREPIVARFASLQKIHEIEAKFSEKQKLFGLIGLRFVMSPFFDYANYAAGLTSMSYPTFLISTFAGILPYAFIVYYVGNLSLYQGPLVALMFFVGLAIIGGIVGKMAFQKFLVK